MSERGLFGLTGSFASPEALTAAARQLRSLGFREVEAYHPLPGRRASIRCCARAAVCGCHW